MIRPVRRPQRRPSPWRGRFAAPMLGLLASTIPLQQTDSLAAEVQAERKPNIVVIVADDKYEYGSPCSILSR